MLWMIIITTETHYNWCHEKATGDAVQVMPLYYAYFPAAGDEVTKYIERNDPFSPDSTIKKIRDNR